MSMASSNPVKKTLFGADFLNDPYTTYRRFLDEGPVHFVDVGPGFWGAFSYDACTAALKDPRFSSRRAGALLLQLPEDRRGEFAELARTMGLWLLFMDAPEHTRLRKLMNKGFSASALEGLRPRVEAIVERMIAPMGAQAEVMSELAHPMPVQVIAELLGIPDQMHAELEGWSNAIATFLGNPCRTIEQTAAAQDAVKALTEYFRGAVEERRGQMGDDLISMLLRIEEGGEVLTEEELYAQCVMLLFGGHETTRNLIGNGLYTLLGNPEEMERLRDQPQLIRSGVEELLRFESPVQYTSRIVKEPVEMGGYELRPGQVMLVMLAAANHDSAQFREPEKLDLGRANNAHLALGAGAHFCIGNQIARLEGQAAILGMVKRFPKMRLDKAAWVENFSLRGLKTLEVSLAS